MGRYVKDWNALDTVIYYIELFAARIIHRLHDEAKEPAVEEIIMAETQYLQDEITYYRAHQRPGRIVEQRGVYFCPECEKSITSELVNIYMIKYCPECGKRITKQQPLSFMAKNKSESIKMNNT